MDDDYFDDERTLGGIGRDEFGIPPDPPPGEDDPTVGGPRSRRRDPLAPGAAADPWSAEGGGAPLFGDVGAPPAAPPPAGAPPAAMPPGRPSDPLDPLFGDDTPSSQTWGTRRMDRYDRLPGERDEREPAGPRPRRSRRARRRRHKTIWLRRLVALALLIAIVVAIVVAVMALTGDEATAEALRETLAAAAVRSLTRGTG